MANIATCADEQRAILRLARLHLAEVEDRDRSCESVTPPLSSPQDPAALPAAVGPAASQYSVPPTPEAAHAMMKVRCLCRPICAAEAGLVTSQDHIHGCAEGL